MGVAMGTRLPFCVKAGKGREVVRPNLIPPVRFELVKRSRIAHEYRGGSWGEVEVVIYLGVRG